jgi:hypothetical protein
MCVCLFWLDFFPKAKRLTGVDFEPFKFLPKAKPVTTHGLGFEDARKRLIATPPPKAAPKGKQAAKQPKRAKR